MRFRFGFFLGKFFAKVCAERRGVESFFNRTSDICVVHEFAKLVEVVPHEIRRQPALNDLPGVKNEKSIISHMLELLLSDFFGKDVEILRISRRRTFPFLVGVVVDDNFQNL